MVRTLLAQDAQGHDRTSPTAATGETRTYKNLLKETIFGATQTIRAKLGADDWCVSVFADNAGVVKFDDNFHVCFKVETHNHPSAIEPYGGANTGLGGVIRDLLGTGLGAQADLQHRRVLLRPAGLRRRSSCRRACCTRGG